MNCTEPRLDLETEVHILKFQRNNMIELNDTLEKELNFMKSNIEMLRAKNLRLKKSLNIAVNKDIEYRYFLSNNFLYIAAFKCNKLIAAKGWSIKNIKKELSAKSSKQNNQFKYIKFI